MKKVIIIAAAVTIAMVFAAKTAKKEGNALSAAYYGKQQMELKKAGLLP